MNLKLRSVNFYILSLTHHRPDAADHKVVFQETAIILQSDMWVAHIKLPTSAFPTFESDTCSWLHYRDTFETLIVNNTALSNVKKFHYLIASHKNEAKDLISNLQINENFLVAWQLVTWYNNKQLIAMMHTKHLCHMPQVRKGDASLLRQLINHVSSHVNALQALFFIIPKYLQLLASGINVAINK